MKNLTKPNYKGDWTLRMRGMLALIMKDKNLSDEDRLFVLDNVDKEVSDCRQKLNNVRKS